MFGVDNLWLFMASGLVFSMLPGPDSLYIVGRSASQGFRAGSVATLGVGTGTFVHILAAAFGLSALLATSAMAFTVVKLIGCLYLLYMGVTMLLAKADRHEGEVQSRAVMPLFKIYYKGFLTSTLNPKVALFFLAFVPQFIAADFSNKALSFIFLGVVYNLNAMIWCHFLAWTSSKVSARLKESKWLGEKLAKLTGCLFLYFGFKLAYSSQS